MKDQCGLLKCALVCVTLAFHSPIKAQLSSGNGWVHFGGVNAVSVIPSVAWNNKEDDLIDRGMTQDMVVALIGQPADLYWDNGKKTCFHAVYKYELYDCSFVFSHGVNGRESHRSEIIAKYVVRVKVYYVKDNDRWIVYKVVGSTKDYNAYRENDFKPIRRMGHPDDAVLLERYQ